MTLPAQDIAERREWLIRKDGYFYRPNCQGYTTRKIEAGRYTKAKAEAEASVEPWHMSAVHQDDIPDEPAVADLNSEITRLTADNEALRNERDAARAAHHKTSHKAVKRLRALWREKQAAESRITALEAEVGRLQASLRDQFCPRPCNWRPSEFDVGDCVDAGECGCSARSALANEEAGR